MAIVSAAVHSRGVIEQQTTNAGRGSWARTR